MNPFVKKCNVFGTLQKHHKIVLQLFLIITSNDECITLDFRHGMRFFLRANLELNSAMLKKYSSTY